MSSDLLLNLWRESCRHIELDQSIESIARLVTGALPADLLVVRRLDADRGVIETVAAGAARPGVALPADARTECSPDVLRQVLSWSRDARILRGAPGGSDPLLRWVAPARTTGDCLAGALVSEGLPRGVVVLIAPTGAFDASHEALFRELIEPIAVAFANDARLHELARLRDALEADKQALLSRLERHDVAEAIVGADGGLRSVMQQMEQVAATDAPVLIIGETGTGKEVLARALHGRSRRSQGPIVRVNCGAIPPGLVDSELFGHERGSFTGAVSTRRGWFERADGGTLFLDEIGELTLDAQVRLLRILQDGTFERVGAHRALTVDVRIIAATNRDLRDMVALGRFREDLWYRIGVFPIYLPPLRERLEDLPPLAAHFAWRAGKRLGGAPLAVSPEDLSLLLGYSWPGNVRELAAVIERAAILGNGHRLNVAAALGAAAPLSRSALPAGTPDSLFPGTGATPDSLPPGAGERVRASGESETTLNAAMATHIRQALERARGRIEGPRGAAAALGINPHTLRARMRKLGIDWSEYRRTP
jgi:hydrogenase-4 transcriptional activator